MTEQENTPIETAAIVEGNMEDASAALVSSPAPVKVFDAVSAAQGEIVRGLLDTEGIPAVFESVAGASLDQVFFGETFHGEVLVAAEDEERALQLIDAYTKAALTDADDPEAAISPGQ